MLCYDRTKGAVNGFQMARLTQRQMGSIGAGFSINAGQILSGAREQAGQVVGDMVSDAIDQKVDSFFGNLLGKSVDKKQFDAVRQQVWNQFAAIVNAVDGLQSSATLTREGLQTYMRSLQKLLDSYNSYYNRARAAVTPAYGDSRFHDFYDPMLAKYNEWNAELSAMGGGGFFGSSGVSSGTMILIAAVGLAIFAGSRK